MSLTIEQIAQLGNARIVGDLQATISNVRPVESAAEGDLTFATDKHKLRLIVEREPSCAAIAEDLESLLPENCKTTFLVVDDPLQLVLRAFEILRPQRTAPATGISPHAYVSESAVIGTGTTIQAGAHVGDDVEIGNDCTIHTGVVVGAGSRIGNRVTLHPYVVLYEDVEIGNNVIVHAGSVFGADGFGYRLRDGRHERLPHFGTVKICDDVEIGVGTVVDRALIGETSIGEGTKIDNLVVVAHNCELGRHNILVSQVGFAGSVTTGDYVVCAGQVGVADHVHLGDQCVLGAQSGVHKDMAGGRSYFGSPAAPIEESTKQLMALRKLPAIRQSVRSLEKQVAELTGQLQALTKSISPPSDSEPQVRDSAA